MFRLPFNRPLILAGIAVGVALYFALTPWIARPFVRALIGWDGCVIVLLYLTYAFVSPGGNETMRRIVELRGEGGRFLAVAVLASVASTVGLAIESTKTFARYGAVFAILLAVVTIVLSWLFIQVIFALRYAHHYFRPRADGQRSGGLNFGEEGDPDFWDFLHFAIVLGAAAQTGDIVFTTREMRRIGTVHTLVAFGFNTAILASMINVLLSALPAK